MGNDNPENYPGIAAAIDDLGTDDLEQVEPVQLDMFASPALSRARNGRGEVIEALPERTGRPGRPKGARNRSTQAWTQYILSRYQSPLVFLAETMSRPATDLAAELECDQLEAFKIQMVAASKLAEYVHQKQPVSADREGVSAGRLVINTKMPSTDRLEKNRPPKMHLRPPETALTPPDKGKK